MTQQVLPTSEAQTEGKPEALSPQYPPLTAWDRCDAPATQMDPATGRKYRGTCGAQAFIRAVLTSGQDLLFCGHCLGKQPGPSTEVHRSRYAQLAAAGAVFHDEYDSINLKPTETDSTGVPAGKGF